MNKPKQNKKQLLIDNLYQQINLKGQQDLQLKPDEFQNHIDGDNEDFSIFDNKESQDLEEYKKDYSSRIDKQINIISQNIMNSLFGLNNQKFSAFMSRYNVWGFDLTMQQFIESFYLVVKTDNMLRQFVLDHKDKLIKTTREVMQKYLITHMSDFRFRETRTDYNRKKLMDKLKKNQLDINNKLQKRSIEPVKENQEDKSLATTPNTDKPINTTPVEAVPSVEGLNVTVPTGGVQNRIFSLNEMMKMSEDELNQVTNITAPSPIENNLSGITPPPIPTPEEALGLQNPKEQEPTTPPEAEKQNEEEQQSEEQQNMEQQILNNLRQEHQNLQRGATTNG